MDPFMGELRLFAFDFAPPNWAMCWGQALPIAQHDALYSLLGVTYGGDGDQTFNLPDLRGRAPVAMGRAPGLNDYQLGAPGGSETVTLNQNQLPAHTHTVNAASTSASKNPSDNLPGVAASGGAYGPDAAAVMSSAMITGGGSNQPHDNMPPYLPMNWCIALEGIYPSRG